MGENVLLDKSFEFAKTIVLFQKGIKELRQFEIASQLIRSGTSIGANVREAQRAESRKDFRHRLQIALKEADETKYWLELIEATICEVPPKIFDDVEELIKILVSIVVKTKD